MKVRIVISGRGYNVAEHLPGELELPDGSSVSDALQQLNGLLGASCELPATCLVAVAGKHLGTVAAHHPQVLSDQDELVIIAPVAGG